MRAMLERSGEIGRDLLAVDWAATPLGPPDGWPRSLQTVVRMLITSRFSMWMAWGPELTFFCNEAYRRDTLGKKYPWALGKPASVVWSEVWHDAGPRIQHVLSTGEATWDKSLQLFLERSGYVEETYHTFSYSPLADDQGAVAGMLCVVTEDTQEVIGHRRMGALRDLGARTATKLGADEALAQACRQLADSPEDLPFTLVYLLDGESGAAHLAGSTGFKGEHVAAPAELVPDSPDAVWPALPTLDGRTVVVDDLERRFTDLPTGCWPEPPLSAVLLPLAQSSQAPPYGFLVAGVNRYRPLDDGYRDFLELLAGQLAGTINDARAFDFERQRAETLAQLDRAKTDFFTNISHEFRTPLTLLLGPAEDALSDADQPLPDRQRGRVDVILRNGQRLLKLVNTLLDFSRLESGRLEAHFEPLDLAAYTRELAAMFDAAAERLGLTLTVDCPPLPEEVYVDRDLWAKIVLNLLSNALKFTFTGGIAVRLRAEGHEAVLSVTDTGTGIPPGELPHLFERFHRVHGAASRTHEGSGIGLALVSELTELHGGHVAAESVLDVGSTLTVRVPFGTAHVAPGSVARRSGDGTASALRDAQGFLEEVTHLADGAREEALPVPRRTPGEDVPRILVVDDNADIRDYVVNLLAGDYRVDTAVDGADGLAKARDSVPDLVLTDVMMPRMDGFELLAALQEDPLTLGVPVVMLSARAGEEGMLEGLDAGADDYLIKPFTGRELLARVRANLELDRARRVRRQVERSRSLLDQAQRLAQVGSWEIDLRDRRTGGLGRVPAYRRAEPGGARRDGLPRCRARAGAPRGPAAGAGHAGRRSRRSGHRLRGPDAAPRRTQRAGRRARRGGPRRRGSPGADPRLGAGHHRAPRRRGGARARGRQRRGGRPRARDRRPAAAQPAPPAHRRPRAPRGRDLLPRRRRGNPGRRRLVRRDRARRRSDRPRGRRRDGPRGAGRGGHGSAARGDPGLRAARPAARRRPRVPRRHRPRARGEPDRHLPVRRLRPGRPDAPDGQRRPPAADPGGAGPGVAHPVGRRGPAARRGTVHAHPAGRQARRGLAGGALHRRPRGAARGGPRARRARARPPRQRDGRSPPRGCPSVWCRRCCPTDRTTTWPCWWPASTRRRASTASSNGSRRTRAQSSRRVTWSRATSPRGRCRARWSTRPC